MADFTMCSNQECLLADYCQRQTAQRSKRQSFAYFAPNKGAESCDSMIPNDQYKSFLIISGREDELNPFSQFLRGGRTDVKIRFIDYGLKSLYYHYTPKSKV